MTTARCRRVVISFGFLLTTSALALAQSAIDLSTIDVQAPAAPESAYGPVDGYVATRSATATKTDTPLKETPQSVSVIGEEQVRDQGAVNLQATLRYTPGVFADAYGLDSRGDYPRVRGSDPNIFLNGMRVTDSWKFNEWRADPYMLTRIEVLRGPSSVLYGDTSTAGLINLVPKLPQEKELHEIGVQYGTWDRKQVQTDHTGKLTEDGQFLYRLIGIARDSGMQTDYVPDDRVLVMPAVTWRPSAQTDWTVFGWYQKDKSSTATQFFPHSGTIHRNPNGQIPTSRFAGEPDFDLYQTESASISSLFEHRFSESFKVRQSMRYLHIDGIYNTIYPWSFGPGSPWVDPGRTSVNRWVNAQTTEKNAFTADTNAEFKFSTGPVSHKAIVGFDYRHLDEQMFDGGYMDTRPFNLYNPVYLGVAMPAMLRLPATSATQLGVYAQDQVRLDRWIAVASVRHDFVTSEVEGKPNQDEQATSMRLGLMYELPFGLTPYISYAQSFNPIFGSAICVGFCKAQRGEQYEVGFKFSQTKDFVLNGALFDVTERNRLASNPNSPLRMIQTGEVRIRGGELEAQATLWDKLDLIGAYTYLDTEVVAGDNVGKHIETVPEQQASLWAKYRFALGETKGFWVGGGVRYTGRSWDGTDTIETPDYVLFDAGFGWENDHWRFQVNAVNLEDKVYLATCLARGDCFYGIRRTILANLTYKF